MENIRFYKEEEQGDLDFAKKLASLGDIYINDAFSCSHRNHASITGIAKFLPSAAGLLLESEIDNLEKILSTPKSPFVSIVGGAKISTKLDLLYHLITKSDLLVLGGGMANSFLKAKGYDVGNSLYEEDLIDKAIDLINKSEQNHCKLILPIDVVVSRSVNDPDFRIISPDDILADEMILDIGPKTIQLILQELLHAKTLVWNGPMGAFEFKPYDLGTINLAKHVAQLTKNKQLTSVAGGGDIVSALTMSELIDDFSYVSTAGGAFLEWLEGKGLCGIEALKK